nr:hypothetical protein [uncultured Dysosmobacter sp.]
MSRRKKDPGDFFAWSPNDPVKNRQNAAKLNRELRRRTFAARRYFEKEEEKARRNLARLKSCPLHDFDPETAMKEEAARRKANQEQTGVLLNVRLPYYCRCKNCGGKVRVEFAAIYMQAVHDAQNAARKENAAHE